jgi:hypothetical protein
MEQIEVELPYFLFGDEFPLHVYAFEIEPCNEEKRIRVFGTQLTDTVVDNTTLGNFNWNIGIFFKFGGRLIQKYPHREAELNKIMITFWTRMQSRYKQLKGN